MLENYLFCISVKSHNMALLCTEILYMGMMFTKMTVQST
jgi:hypothetical protein